ncbi:hypothetical protein EYF80_064232 [Liparis tanakae]|uniref:Uncharacterized protein n=1 Tax=Liparis tanakae TaxID=230148 RepID=A0A4Z2E9U4_9TELE|nr:hypothetical protein EYF80_064232 [Liparis tanakae]
MGRGRGLWAEGVASGQRAWPMGRGRGLRDLLGSAPQSPAPPLTSYSARSTKLFSLILRTRTRSPPSWRRSPAPSPRRGSASRAFSVTCVCLPQAWRHAERSAASSATPRPAEQSSSEPSSQGRRPAGPAPSGAPGEEGREGGSLGRFGFSSAPRSRSKSGSGSRGRSGSVRSGALEVGGRRAARGRGDATRGWTADL